MKALIPFRSRHRPSVQLERRPCLIRKEVCPRGQASRHGRSCGFLLLGCLGLLLRRNGAPKLCIACSSTTTAPRKKKEKEKVKENPVQFTGKCSAILGATAAVGLVDHELTRFSLSALHSISRWVCVCAAGQQPNRRKRASK
jgi:hypothetical protein